MRTQTTNYVARLFAGDLSAFGGPAADEAVAGQIRAEQMSLVLGYSVGIMLANACNAIVLAIALWPSPDRIPALIWAASVAGAAIAFGLQSHAARRITKPQFVSRRAMHRLVRNAFILGAAWGIVPVAFFAGASTGGQLVITCLCAGMLAGGALAFATIPIAAIAFTAPIFLGIAICLGRNGDLAFLLIAFLVVVYGSVLLRSVFVNSFSFARRVMRQIEAERTVRLDSLTHLPNRVAFNETLDAALKRLALSGEEFAVLLLDLDRFKEVNDQFGHPAGDEFLVQVANRLQRCTRAAEHVARIGGDEFALVMANLTRPEDALEIAERFVAAFAEPFQIEGRQIVGATSVGIVLAPRDGNTPLDLMKNADAALYRAKKAGPGTVCFFEQADDRSSRERKAVQSDLTGAIVRDELFLVFQPFLDLGSNRITGFEALLRWQHPTRGLVPPSEFIAIAEETGLIHEIGEWVIRRACATVAEWPEEIRVAVNFSAAQFHNTAILQTIVEALAEARIAPHRLEIEITESMLLSKYGSAATVLNALLELGVTVALDDFGTGFSSLTYLRKLPFSRIKIDQSFIRDMLVQPDCAAIVKSVISLARDLQIGVVAEGVETADQLEYLRQINCDEVQGYLISRPVAADGVMALLETKKYRAIYAA
ncbi:MULTISPECIES: putative bifunctional diguanylate cyclase/phosphodiesterase [Bradyrhizobium]|uniref:putative bifunctional diguanylate cyclase/phosphodiesterase n=1 Tax=Bradyrhizobium TaxID=374 RepID=UPI00155EAB78|nr:MULTISPECIES: EAL domain-containing protein [Bradyrhizobium]MDD1519275.1 GGDEF-domain containing protein [Bradyrhizobium sp. WBAH30]MDD1543519.1 GGDEF-domain containing protein [Bradyrhizobium sp. WBAH41]MDD1557649.1 GGDEF-domain containing protein [Bradyrhizobium sp. WBAH23]MDD1565062.1 GGDEF-domain containing protein [Bradyrhizobium sp. WBAH33]MDD1590469.1 GGDEF-domain containing protein [Bradyrhizobium sp. WBAH42]